MKLPTAEMNFWLVLGLTLLCVAQVWSKPNGRFGKEEDESYIEDDARESEDPGDGGDQDNYDENESQGSSQGPVQVLTEPKVFELAAGSVAFLPCRFLNADQLTISWEKLKAGNRTELYLDNIKIATQDHHLDLLRNNTLVIRGVSANDEAEYVCTVQQFPKEDGKENKHVKHRLVLKRQPEPTGEPVELKVAPAEYNDINQGSSIMLDCEAHGLTPSSMSWVHKGQRKISEKNVQSLRVFVQSATRKDAGQYACTAETGAPNPLVKYVELKVRHAPEIEYEKDQEGHPRKEYYTALGVETNISCVVHSHPPVHRFHWYKGDQQIHIDGHHFSTSVRKISHHILSIRNTSEADLGQYHCRAKNDLGEVQGPIISVKDTPGKPVLKNVHVADHSIELTWSVFSHLPIVESELMYRKNKSDVSEWQKNEIVKHDNSMGKEHIIVGVFNGTEADFYEAKLRTRNAGHSDSNWGPYSDVSTFNGDYNEAEARSEKGSSARATISLLTMLLAVASLAYSPVSH